MQIIVKGIKGFEIYDDNKEYVEKKFRKFEKLLKEPAILEVAFEHTHATRANIDKVIKVTLTMPSLKNPMHWEDISEHFTETVDKLQDRMEKYFQRFKEKAKQKR